MALLNSSDLSVKRTTDTPPRIRAMRAHDWVEGAIRSARIERLDGTLQYVGHMKSEQGEDLIYRCFDSSGNHRTEHTLILNLEAKRVTCTCWDARPWNAYPCPHIGALILDWWKTMQSALPKNINHHRLYPWWLTLNAS